MSNSHKEDANDKRSDPSLILLLLPFILLKVLLLLQPQIAMFSFWLTSFGF